MKSLITFILIVVLEGCGDGGNPVRVRMLADYDSSRVYFNKWKCSFECNDPNWRIYSAKQDSFGDAADAAFLILHPPETPTRNPEPDKIKTIVLQKPKCDCK